MAGGLLILVAVLLIVTSFLNLAEYRSPGDPTQGLSAYRNLWGAWKFTDATGATPDTQQLLGIGMSLAAVFAALGGVLLLAGSGAGKRAVRALEVTSGALAFGLSVTVVFDVGSAPLTVGDNGTASLGPGFWTVLLAALGAVAAVALLLSVKGATTSVPTVDAYGRPLSPRASGLDIAVGVLSVPLAALMVAATFFDQLRSPGFSMTMWRAADKTQLVGVPFVLGAVVVLIAAVLAFTGRGGLFRTAGVAALFAAGVLVVLDTVDQELFGPVHLGDFGIGFWLLIGATVLALLVTVLALVAAIAGPRHRTPYAPVAQVNPQWNAPNVGVPGAPQFGYPQAGPQGGFPQAEPYGAFPQPGPQGGIPQAGPSGGYPQVGPEQGGYPPGAPTQNWSWPGSPGQ